MTDATGRARTVAAYERLWSCLALGGTLTRTREPARVRTILERILADGRRLLDDTRGSADPYLLSHVRMALAAASFDLAAVASDDIRRERVREGLDHALASVRAARASGTPMLPCRVLPWALVVLAGGLRVAEGHARELVAALIERCALELPKAEDERRRAWRDGARALFRSQLLFAGAERVADRGARTVVLRRALGRARQARRALLGGGDRSGAAQAKDAVARIDAALATLS